MFVDGIRAEPGGGGARVRNEYGNLNAGDPNAWTWVRDESVRVRSANAKRVQAVRLTSQVTQKNRVGS